MTLQRDKVILVNEQDERIGAADKMAVHRSGALHRALSIFITNSHGEMLLQQRAAGKYHSGGLWSNACCSHPAPGEATAMAAARRLREELGIETALTCVQTLCYEAPVGGGLTEHEYDHIFSGCWDGDVLPAPEEADDFKWLMPEALDAWMAREPQAFTAWFPLLLKAWRAAAAQVATAHA